MTSHGCEIYSGAHKHSLSLVYVRMQLNVAKRVTLTVYAYMWYIRSI